MGSTRAQSSRSPENIIESVPPRAAAGTPPEPPGVPTRSLAGVGAALHLDAFAGQINPGAMPFVFSGFEAALTVFSAEGFKVATMDAVAAEAGVTKPVLYQHFPSKRELFHELIRDVARRLRSDVTDAIGAATSPHDMVRRGMRAVFTRLTTRWHSTRRAIPIRGAARASASG